MGAYWDTKVTHLIIIQWITHSIFLCFCSHWLFLRFRRSTQMHESSWPGSIIPSHPLSFSRIPCESRQRCGGVLMMSILPSSYAISPHCPPVPPHVFCSQVGVCVIPWILVSEIDFSLMRTRIQVICGSKISIVNWWPGSSKIHVKMINFHLLGWGS